jgi:hypothetical protein
MIFPRWAAQKEKSHDHDRGFFYYAKLFLFMSWLRRAAAGLEPRTGRCRRFGRATAAVERAAWAVYMKINFMTRFLRKNCKNRVESLRLNDVDRILRYQFSLLS